MSEDPKVEALRNILAARVQPYGNTGWTVLAAKLKALAEQWAAMGIVLAVGLTLSACSATQVAAVQAAAVKGQLSCAKATQYEPLIVAVANAAGAPIIATGATSEAVHAVCAGIDAVPVPPPVGPVPTVIATP